MLNRSASLAMSTSVLKALPGKLDIKRHSPSILYILVHFPMYTEQQKKRIFCIFGMVYKLGFKYLSDDM